MISLFQITTNENIKNLLLRDDVYKDILIPEPLNIDNINFLLLQQTKYFVIIQDSNIVGIFIISLNKVADATAIAYGIYKAYRGKNTKSIIHKCMELTANYSTHYIAEVHKNNISSQKLLTKLGFQYKTTINDILLYAEI